MNSSKLAIIGILLFLLAVLTFNAFFIVGQTEQALVLRFGKPVNIINAPGAEDGPGLKFKMPFVDSVEMFDKRVLVFNGEPMTVILKDKDRLIVDAFVTYRIKNPLQFYQAVRSERIMSMRLESILEKSLRDVLGRETLKTLLSDKRVLIMHDIRDNVFRLASGKAVAGEKVEAPIPEEAIETEDLPEELVKTVSKEGFGIEVVDVRIMRTDLPKETGDAIYNRMRSDRQKVAEKYRAEGQRESQIIRSEADKQRTIMLAEAKKQAETIRGEGDGAATKIFAEAFGKDEDFFDFYRTMQAYRESLDKDDTTLILSPNNEFLKYIERNR